MRSKSDEDKLREGTIDRKGARCILTGAVITFSYLRAEAKAGNMPQRLMAIAGLWKEGARFHEDDRIGKGSQFFKFNEYGFQSICNLTGAPVAALRQLQKPELASTVLNDLMDGLLSADQTTNRAEIILDESTGVIIGVVSQNYVGYSNDAFLRDVLISLDKNNDGAPPQVTSFSK